MTTTWPIRPRPWPARAAGAASRAAARVPHNRTNARMIDLRRGPGGRSYPQGVPEGDTIHYAANRIRPVLEGRVPDELAPPHPRFGRDRWPERLGGRAVTSVDALGKHLFLRFEGALVIHSHLRLTGKWRVREAADWTPPAHTWLLIARGDKVPAQINGPVLELMPASRARFDRRIAQLGPDILAPDLDE